MSAYRHAIAACLLLSATARAACEFDAYFEITNPFDPSCGGVRLTYTENDNTGNNIALGYPVPSPVDSLTAVDGFRSYDSLHAQHQFLMTEHDTVAGEVVGHTVAGREIWAYVLGDPDARTVDERQRQDGFACRLDIVQRPIRAGKRAPFVAGVASRTVFREAFVVESLGATAPSS